ncbi:hypothetical protein ACS0TY_009210 [Phlomoides rotata]
MNILVRRTIVVFSTGLLILLLNKHRRRVSRRRRRFSVLDRIPTQIKNLSDLVDLSDEDCRDQLRMNRATFYKLCFMLQSMGGLKSSRRVTVTKKVAMFLSVLAHHTKNRCVKFQFKRSGQTVSKHFHAVLHCVLRMQSLFLVKPHPVNEDSTDARWQKFPEGSTSDSRVLRNVITRSNGFKVPKGNYYLCDNGYPNCEGFLTPYKGV